MTIREDFGTDGTSEMVEMMSVSGMYRIERDCVKGNNIVGIGLHKGSSWLESLLLSRKLRLN